jgi:hypothetical protein
MASLFTAKGIVEQALRKIGAYAINDTAPDDEHVRIGLEGLDLIMAEQAGSTRCWWLVHADVSVALDTADQRTYDLTGAVAAVTDGDAFQFPVSAALVDEAGDRTPLRLLRADEYDAVTDKAESGSPCAVYIDRLAGEMHVYPVPSVATYSVALTVQTESAALIQDNRVTGVQASDARHGLRASWQMWAVYRLAAWLGDGTIRRCSPNEVAGFLKLAEWSERRLLAFENREHDDSFQVQMYD